MRALDRKLLRDLRRLWAQSLAIAMVLGAGIMILVGAELTGRTLAETRAAFYDRARFADVFAGLTRAPASLVEEIARIEGVAAAEGRATGGAILDLPGMDEPATARLVSLPRGGTGLNLTLLRRGRLPDPDRPEEVALSEPFAEANGLLPGTRLSATFGGQRRSLRVTGWVLSPEFVYTIAPGGLMPDDRHYGVVWMGEGALAAALGMQGAVNEVSLRLGHGADSRAVIAEVDRLLEPWGRAGAQDRSRQTSHAFLDSEMSQLSAMARVVPPVFLIVAAFLVNMVLTRLIARERALIGLFKALGYGNREIAAHYLRLALLVGAIGTVLGWAMGFWIAEAMIGLYRDYFRFPFILRQTAPGALAISAVLGLGVALLGGLRAVHQATRLAPAEAMRPPAPPVFTRGLLDRLTSGLGLRQTSLMILRGIQRWPGRAAVTMTGIAASTALLMLAYFMFDAVDLLGDSVFRDANRQEVTLSLAAPAPTRAVHDALALPGARAAEGALVLAVELVAGHRKTTTVLSLRDGAPRLARLVDDLGRVQTLPRRGLVLPERLAAKLALEPGDMVDVRLLTPPRKVLRLPVARLISQGLGQEAHAAAGPVLALLDMAPQVNRIDLSVEARALGALRARLKSLPAVAGFVDWAEVRRQFDATLAESLLTMVTIYTMIGALITLGVVYNAARIQLAEREHELASLRVLGFTRGEVGFVLVGEMMLLALLAVPFGWVLGLALAEGMMRAVSTDIIQIPVVVTRRTYALAAIATLVAALAAALVVRRHLDRTDIAAVLKNAE